MKTTTALLIMTFLLSGCASRTPEEVGEQYCSYLLEGDYDSFKALFGKKRQKLIHETTFKNLRPTKCIVESISPPYVIVCYRLPLDEDWPEETGVLYILPDSSIKYDPIFTGHPALALPYLLLHMENDNIEIRQSAFRTLTKWGIPLFGFIPDADMSAHAHSIDQLREWIEQNQASFDLVLRPGVKGM